MYELITFFTRLALAYLLLGCMLVGAISLLLRLCSLNAAARHKIWVTVLLVLVLAPFFSLLPNASKEDSESIKLIEERNYAEQTTRAPSIEQEEYLSALAAEIDTAVQGKEFFDEPGLNLGIGYSTFNALSAAVVKMTMFPEFLASLCAVLALGIFSKFVFYVRSLRSLRALIDASEQVEGEWAEILEQNSNLLNMRRRVELRQSGCLSTPSTCGVLNPCIILPIAMVCDGSFSESRAQILQHELAHIKRRDTLVAGLQAIFSIFLFWHPAVGYANKQIRIEREIACDDWVVSHSEHSSNTSVRAYAYSIVDIAETLSAHTPPAHSLACVSNSLGLQARIQILLDRKVDHSTSVEFVPNLWMATMAIGFLFSASALLPKIPQSTLKVGMEAESTENLSFPEKYLQDARVFAEPITEIEPSVHLADQARQELVDYELPLPVPKLSSRFNIEETFVTLSRAEKIKSTFEARAAESLPLEKLFIDSINSVVHRVDSFPVAEFSQLLNASQVAVAPIVNTANSESSDLIIIDNLSKAELAVEIRKVGVEFYRVFNAITDRDDMKVHCETQAVTGSHIRKTICEPEFLRTARSENISNSAGLKNYNTSVGLEGDMKAEYTELAAEILHEMKSNQYLLELYQVLEGLRGRLMEMA
ncbi:MAG: hypothetical protein COA78_17675 [Blastopirellula sp.]|nr:MAG: hypothetical protein COA78_17675 [Blastopirellula sp.]